MEAKGKPVFVTTLLLAAAFAQRASILDDAGQPLPIDAPAGTVLAFDSTKAERGPNTVSVMLPAGQGYSLKPVTDGILWIVEPPQFRANLKPSKDRATLYVATGLDEATLRVTQIVAKGDKADMQTVSVHIVGRTPPKPPDPPPVPVPTDPFFTALKAAFAQDTDQDKTKRADALAGVYKAAINEVVINEQAKELQQRIHKVADNLVGFGSLAKTRRALADELNRQVILTPDTVINADLQSKLQGQFGRFAKLLGAL